MSSLKRTTNFTNQEEAILVALVQKHQAIIECRKTDAVTNSKKNETWSNIAMQFNSASGVKHRDAKILKNKFDNIKKRTKRKAAEEKCALFNTGGGPPEVVIFTPVEEQVKEILGVRVDGLVSEFDDDALTDMNVNVNPVMNENDDDNHEELVLNDEEVENLALGVDLSDVASGAGVAADDNNYELVENSPRKNKKQTGDWTKGTPKLLKSSKSAALKTPSGGYLKRREIGSKMEQWVVAKSEAEQAKTQCLLEESRLRMDLMKQEYKKKMEILELEHKAKEKREEEAHQLRMDLLRGNNQ